MRIQFLLFFLVAGGSASFAQIGIGTSNPITVFHVDGGADNPAFGSPSAVESDNDVFVNASGQLGLGVLPTSKMDINGQIRITGGSPGVDKVLETSSTGLATWKSSWRAIWSGFSAGQSGGNMTGGSFTEIGSGGTLATNSIRVPSTGIYKVTVSLLVAAAVVQPTLTFNLYVNGVDTGVISRVLIDLSQSEEFVCTFRYISLNANDVISLVRSSTGSLTYSSRSTVEVEFIK